ncbi:MAG: ribosomal-processing cysteine protease Prp [Clostridia bacterium]|nr:ribosomal-processing cysteine protease Prp [Clostridia bacterium]
MITVRFAFSDGLYTGFSVHGHAGLAPKGEDVLCASVSSAAYLVANTLTEVCKVPCDAAVSDGEMTVRLSEWDDASVQTLLKGFALHMRELSRQYPRQLKVIYGGKNNA